MSGEMMVLLSMAIGLLIAVIAICAVVLTVSRLIDDDEGRGE